MPGESTQLLETLAKSTCGSCGITCEPGTQDISLCAARDISEIHINAGDLVDRIEIRYRDGTSAIHGAKGGNKMKPFLFKPGEKLVRISVRQGDSLDGCQFYLDSGRCSEWYGGRGGRSGSFEASPHRSILDIVRPKTGFCPRISDIVQQADCCICHADKHGSGHIVEYDDTLQQWCDHCSARWGHQRELEKDLQEPQAMTAWMDKVGSARDRVGPALQRRLDIMCSAKLLATPGGVSEFLTLVDRGELTDILYNGKLDVSIDGVDKTDQKPTKGCRRSLPPHLQLTSIAASNLAPLEGRLVFLDVSGHAAMQSLPVKELLQISSLTRLESVGCPGFVHALLNTADGVHDFVALLNKVQFKTVFEDGELNLSMDGRLMQGVPPAAAKLLSQIAHGLSGLGDALTSINVSGMPSLERLPVPELVDLPTLTSLNCQGCPRLYSPPPDVANRGGVNVMKYLRLADPKQGGRFNTIIELILIGRGESGKTSVKKSLIQGTSEKIHEDKRTVGIDMTQWDLGAEANGLVFNIKDLAGQAVYSLSNQFFLVPRAIFALVWRVLPTMSADQESFELEVADMISTWLDAIQLRVPGATVVIVATHIDCAAPSQVDLQCKWVQALVDKKLAAFEQDEVTSSVRPLSVWLRGQSCRVNCLDGTGVQELKTNLISLAHSLPWWQEVVPGIFLDFQRELVEQRVKSPWLSWQCYTKIADACHLPAQHLAIATGFLHDNATIKFFDEFPGATEPEQRSGPVRIESHCCRVRFRSDDTNQGWGWRLVAWPAHEEGSQFLSLEAAARVPGAVVLESNHPYSSDCDETHDVNIAGGGTAMWLAFDERSCTEHGYDTVEILEIC